MTTYTTNTITLNTSCYDDTYSLNGYNNGYNSVTSGMDNLDSKLERQKEDNILAIEDLKEKLSEYEARIQKLESEVELLKSINSNKSNNSQSQKQNNLADFF